MRSKQITYKNLKPIFTLLILFFASLFNLWGQDTLTIQTKNVHEKYRCFCPKPKKMGCIEAWMR